MFVCCCRNPQECPRLVCTCEAAMLIAGQPGSVHKLSACKLHMLCLKLFNHARLPPHTASGQVDKSCRFFSAACLYFLDRLSSRSNRALTGTLQPPEGPVLFRRLMGTPCPPPTLNVQAENPGMLSHRMLMSVPVLTKPCHHAFDADLHKLSCQAKHFATKLRKC